MKALTLPVHHFSLLSPLLCHLPVSPLSSSPHSILHPFSSPLDLCLEPGTEKPSCGLTQMCDISGGWSRTERKQKDTVIHSISNFSLKKKIPFGARTNPPGKISNPCDDFSSTHVILQATPVARGLVAAGLPPSILPSGNKT